MIINGEEVTRPDPTATCEELRAAASILLLLLVGVQVVHGGAVEVEVFVVVILFVF